MALLDYLDYFLNLSILEIGAEPTEAEIRYVKLYLLCCRDVRGHGSPVNS